MGDFPAEAALHREAPPTKKKAVALSKRGGTDADSGLVFLDRVLISPAVPARDTLWLVVDLCLLLALAFGLVSAAVTAFAVHPPVWMWLALAAWCAGWCLFGRLPRVCSGWACWQAALSIWWGCFCASVAFWPAHASLALPWPQA